VNRKEICEYCLVEEQKECLTIVFEGLLNHLSVFFTAALPVVEVRGAIPLGIMLGFTPLKSAVISYLGSIFPAPFIVFAIKPVFSYLKKTRFFHRFVDRVTQKAMRKGGRKVDKYGILGLFIFVAIPLPGTGVWTGSMAAAFLDLKTKPALAAIISGNLVATFLIMVFSDGIYQLIT
jgi:uncharacterized membrane protein